MSKAAFLLEEERGMDAEQIRELKPELLAFLAEFDDCFARRDTQSSIYGNVRTPPVIFNPDESLALGWVNDRTMVIWGLATRRPWVIRSHTME
jgi:hypothetical protein